MSTVFEFEDEDLAALQRRSSHDSACYRGNEYASQDDDTTAPSRASMDGRLYEVSLDEIFVASSVREKNTSYQRRQKVTKDDFEMLKVLGRGAYGKVTLCRHVESRQLYAMKVLKKASLLVHTKNAEHIKSERQILEEVRHPSIVQLMYAFQTEDRLFLILEYAMGGELFTHMATEKMFPERVARFYLAELVLALGHLHSLGIVYRDLKPENCLLDADGHVMLTDFGLSKVALGDGRANTVCGTAEYMAPEILMEMHYDKCVDWWSLGILMYEMLTGDTPFRASNKKKTLDAIRKKKPQIPNYVTSDAKDMLNKFLRKNPNTRLGYGDDGTEQVKAHKWFRRINWTSIKERKVTPPLKPKITDPELAENFDGKFTRESIKETPVETSLDAHMHNYFENFSYVARSHILTSQFEQ
ncbi:hypothetical protein LRAMOSA01331 [Lichtheimia ramosa]|uniref:Uncharacterized protein n=1 Tax=Lichtheimia ramosa TaxID=688394 RepID=A0A077WLH8_9FUNG|nr:hypothetical protein LRAMOSA01331 [Lichtheimia ramosa]